ncbi:MAG: hypothetical protein V4773_21950 [Verrucomicrobiota bacterium]
MKPVAPVATAFAAENRRAGLILFAATLAFTAGVGLALFSAFMFYDDEGYVLVSLRNFAEHGGLYRDVYSQYGPVPYVFHYALWLLGYPLDHIGGRIVTLAFWAGASLLCARLVWHATRHLALSLAALGTAFLYLWVMIREPNHPGGIVAALLALAAFAGFRAATRGRTRAIALVGGALVAALALTKINLGVFAACSVASFFMLHSSSDFVRRHAVKVLVLAGVLLPVALMQKLLGQPWVRIYGLLFAAMAVSFVLIGSMTSARTVQLRFGRREIVTALLAALAVTVLTLGVVIARGTSPGDLLQGVLLGPLRHPIAFSMSFSWPSGVLANTATGCGAAIAAFLLRQSRQRPAIDIAIAGLRLLMLVGLAFSTVELFGLNPRVYLFCYCAPWLWLCLWSLAADKPEILAGTTWLGLLALGQWLHAYPVPGSQVGWGSFLALPLIMVAAWSGGRHLAARASATRVLRLVGGLATAGLLAFVAAMGHFVAQLGGVYWGSRPLNLPGAEIIRIPDATTSAYRILCANAATHADMLFSMPGMCSLNLWSRLPSPTLANTTHWFSLLDEARQRKIIEALEVHPRAALVVQTEHVDFLQRSGFGPKGLLHDYLRRSFAPAFRVDDFEFHVRRGRTIAPFFTAELLQRKDSAGAGTGAPPAALNIPLMLPAGTVVHHIEITMVDDNTTPPVVLDASNTRVELTPIDLAGAPQAAPTPSQFPLRLSAPTLVSIYFNPPTTSLSLRHTLLVLKAPDDSEIALVRLRP